MKQSMTLMNKNTPVMEFTGELKYYTKEDFDDNKGLTGQPYIEATDFKILNNKLIPVSFFAPETEQTLLNKQFRTWFDRRLLSKKRVDVNLENINWKGTAHFFSMTDQYWIRYDKTESWADLNYFTNIQSDTLGDIIFSKNLANINELYANFDSPSLCTNGVVKKRWIQRINEKINSDNPADKIINSLYKCARIDYGQTVVSEIMATRLLKKLKKIIPSLPDFVSYYLDITGYEMCSVCTNFVYPNVECVTAAEIYGATPRNSNSKDVYSHLIEAINQYNIPDGKEYIDSIIIVDRYLMNYDRHLGNIIFLRNIETGEFIGGAPLFDFGNAFFTDAEKYESKFAPKREEELLNMGKIPALSNEDMQEVNRIFQNCNFLNDKQKRSLYLNFCKNNDFLKMKQIEKNAIHNVPGKNNDRNKMPKVSFNMDNF